MSIIDLPREQLIDILHEIPFDHIVRMRPVCTSFNQMISSRSLWIALIYKYATWREWLTSMPILMLHKFYVKYQTIYKRLYSVGSEYYGDPYDIIYTTHYIGDKHLVAYLGEVYDIPSARCEALAALGDHKCLEMIHTIADYSLIVCAMMGTIRYHHNELFNRLLEIQSYMWLTEADKIRLYELCIKCNNTEAYKILTGHEMKPVETLDDPAETWVDLFYSLDGTQASLQRLEAHGYTQDDSIHINYYNDPTVASDDSLVTSRDVNPGATNLYIREQRTRYILSCEMCKLDKITILLAACITNKEHLIPLLDGLSEKQIGTILEDYMMYDCDDDRYKIDIVMYLWNLSDGIDVKGLLLDCVTIEMLAVIAPLVGCTVREACYYVHCLTSRGDIECEIASYLYCIEDIDTYYGGLINYNSDRIITMMLIMRDYNAISRAKELQAEKHGTDIILQALRSILSIGKMREYRYTHYGTSLEDAWWSS